MPDWYSDPSSALREIGWSARTALKDGLVSMSKWVDTLTDVQMAAATKKESGGRRRSVSAVIACYKDAQAIPVMHKRLSETFRQLDVDYELIFVNDGSPDDSADVIREISRRRPTRHRDHPLAKLWIADGISQWNGAGDDGRRRPARR